MGRAIVPPDDLRRRGELDVRRTEYSGILRDTSRAFADIPVEELDRQVESAISGHRRAASHARATVTA